MFKELQISELCVLISRGISPAYDDTGIPVLSQKCIRDNQVLLEMARITNPSRKKVPSEKLVVLHDVLVNSTGVGTLGRVAQVKKLCGQITVDSHVSIVRPDPEKIDPLFFGYAMVLNQPKIEAMGEGATGQTELSRTRLGQEIYISCPSVPIQSRIAGILSAYDELIEINQQRIKILESVVRALYREWFVYFRFPGNESIPFVPSPLGEIPQGWEIKKLGELSSYISRGITPRYDEDGDSVVINQKCVRDQRLNLEPARRQSRNIPRDKLVCFGDVLINSTGVGTLGRVAQVYESFINCTVDTHVTIARALPDTDLDFYGCCLLSLQETFERLGTGATGQTELGRTSISEIELICPTMALQRKFGDAVRDMRLAAIIYAKKIHTLRRTRDLLLPRLLSGQIDLEFIAP